MLSDKPKSPFQKYGMRGFTENPFLGRDIEFLGEPGTTNPGIDIASRQILKLQTKFGQLIISPAWRDLSDLPDYKPERGPLKSLSVQYS